ncbi:hypothetical protein XANCAGTX0491_001848 [Xanthoria calcicola]
MAAIRSTISRPQDRTCLNSNPHAERIFQTPKLPATVPTRTKLRVQSSIMVVFFQEWCPPWVLYAYSTVALTPNLLSLVQHDFNVGTFAQFGDPSEVVRINHRTDFHDMSHLAIRQSLDAENFTDPFILIDEHTAQSHAIWWATTTEDSEDLTARWYPPVTHPGENFTLWQSHILI